MNCKRKLRDLLFNYMKRVVEKMGTIWRIGCGQRQFSNVRLFYLEPQLPLQSTRTRSSDFGIGLLAQPLLTAICPSGGLAQAFDRSGFLQHSSDRCNQLGWLDRFCHM